MSEAEIAPASEFISITQDGEEREIFMTFGLLNEVTRVIGDPANAAAIYFNPGVREVLLLTILQKRNERGKVEEELEDILDVDVSVSDLERLIAWGVDHALDFFGRSMTAILATQPRMEKLGVTTSLLTGSAGSPSKKASPGRSKSRRAS